MSSAEKSSGAKPKPADPPSSSLLRPLSLLLRDSKRRQPKAEVHGSTGVLSSTLQRLERNVRSLQLKAQWADFEGGRAAGSHPSGFQERGEVLSWLAENQASAMDRALSGRAQTRTISLLKKKKEKELERWEGVKAKIFREFLGVDLMLEEGEDGAMAEKTRASSLSSLGNVLAQATVPGTPCRPVPPSELNMISSLLSYAAQAGGNFLKGGAARQVFSDISMMSAQAIREHENTEPPEAEELWNISGSLAAAVGAYRGEDPSFALVCGSLAHLESVFTVEVFQTAVESSAPLPSSILQRRQGDGGGGRLERLLKYCRLRAAAAGNLAAESFPQQNQPEQMWFLIFCAYRCGWSAEITELARQGSNGLFGRSVGQENVAPGSALCHILARQLEVTNGRLKGSGAEISGMPGLDVPEFDQFSQGGVFLELLLLLAGHDPAPLEASINDVSGVTTEDFLWFQLHLSALAYTQTCRDLPGDQGREEGAKRLLLELRKLQKEVSSLPPSYFNDAPDGPQVEDSVMPGLPSDILGARAEGGLLATPLPHDPAGRGMVRPGDEVDLARKRKEMRMGPKKRNAKKKGALYSQDYAKVLLLSLQFSHVLAHLQDSGSHLVSFLGGSGGKPDLLLLKSHLGIVWEWAGLSESARAVAPFLDSAQILTDHMRTKRYSMRDGLTFIQILSVNQRQSVLTELLLSLPSLSLLQELVGRSPLLLTSGALPSPQEVERLIEHVKEEASERGLMDLAKFCLQYGVSKAEEERGGDMRGTFGSFRSARGTMRSSGAMPSLVDLDDDIKSFCLPSSVPKVSVEDLSLVDFLRNFVGKGQPVVIRGLFNWPAFKKWDADFFRRVLGTRRLSVNFTPDGWGDAVKEVEGVPTFVTPLEEEISMEEFFDLLGSGCEERGIPYLSKQCDNLREEAPELIDDISCSQGEGCPFPLNDIFGPADAVNLWIGDHRSVSSMHYDPYENLFTVIKGPPKVFWILPPPCVAFKKLSKKKYRVGTYVRSQGPSDESVVSCPSMKAAREAQMGISYSEEEVPWMENARTLIEEAEGRTPAHCAPGHDEPCLTPIRVLIHPGETLYLPPLWFHGASQKKGKSGDGPTIAVNQWFDMQFGDRWTYFNFLQGSASTA